MLPVCCVFTQVQRRPIKREHRASLTQTQTHTIPLGSKQPLLWLLVGDKRLNVHPCLSHPPRQGTCSHWKESLSVLPCPYVSIYLTYTHTTPPRIFGTYTHVCTHGCVRPHTPSVSSKTNAAPMLQHMVHGAPTRAVHHC